MPKLQAEMAVVVVLSTVMIGLMLRPMREETATADEAWILSAGYAYNTGHGFQLHIAQPPLAKILSAAPLLLMDVKLSDTARAVLEGQAGYRVVRPWAGDPQDARELYPRGRDDWYYWWWMEGEKFGQLLIYDGTNDAERLLFAGRLVQVLLTVLTGIVIFLWARTIGGWKAGVFGLALWVFNPLALGYGHLVHTDAGLTLLFVIALWTFTRFLEVPTFGRAIAAGAAFGGALVMKFTAVILLPTFVVLAVVDWLTRVRGEETRGLPWKRFFPFALACWCVVLLVYAPYWAAPPPISSEQAAKLGIPWWFENFRPLLIPRDFFKGLVLLRSDVVMGHLNFLNGEWRTTGWWYFLPVAMVLKTPLPLLVLMSVGLYLLVRDAARFSFTRLVPWIAAVVYLAFAMLDRGNVGARHLLPLFAVVSVGIATQLGRQQMLWRIGAWIMCGWLAIVTVRAHPFYIEYFNEFGGGSSNGYKHLVDSNLDWGQDVKRLKTFLHERGIDHIYLSYFGVQQAIDYYKISNTRVTAEQARDIKDGTLVISATALMLPEWSWLREQHEPGGRVGYSLFVYRLEP